MTTERLDTATRQWSSGFDLQSGLYKGCAVTISEMEIVTITNHLYGGSYGATHKYNMETGAVVQYDDAPIQVPILFYCCFVWLACFCCLLKVAFIHGYPDNASTQ